jgi:hypothetical protein
MRRNETLTLIVVSTAAKPRERPHSIERIEVLEADELMPARGTRLQRM